MKKECMCTRGVVESQEEKKNTRVILPICVGLDRYNYLILVAGWYSIELIKADLDTTIIKK